MEKKIILKKNKPIQVNSTNFQSEIWGSDNPTKRKAKQIKKLKTKQFNVKWWKQN
jgi:hypothetical protein